MTIGVATGTDLGLRSAEHVTSAGAAMGRVMPWFIASEASPLGSPTVAIAARRATTPTYLRPRLLAVGPYRRTSTRKGMAHYRRHHFRTAPPTSQLSISGRFMTKWGPGDQEELPDDEPLSDEDMAHITEQRIRGQSALIHRAASQGMTPMELFASGQVTAQAPDDALAFDKSRQLPAIDGHSKEECLICGGPCHQEQLWRVASKKLGEQMERLLVAVDPAKDSEDTLDTNPPTIYPGRQERPQTPLQERMEEWLAKDGGKSFKEGFDGYFGATTSRAPEPEAVPPTPEPVNDDEVVEGEIVDTRPFFHSFGSTPEEEDIMDAEVVEDDAAPEGQG